MRRSRMRFISLVVAVMVCVVMMLIGCQSPSTNEADDSAADVSDDTAANESDNENDAVEPEEDDKLVIGYSVYAIFEFPIIMNAGVEAECAEQDVELIFVDAEDDAAKQLGQLDNFIAQEVDAIICAPVDINSLGPTYEKCKEAGIPLVTLNEYPSTPTDAYAGPDDVLAGELIAQKMIDTLGPEGKCVIIQGSDGYSASVDRDIGMENVLKENAGWEVLAKKSAHWSREEALELTENWIEAYGDDIDAVLSHDDEMCQGANQALQAAGMIDDVMTLSIDGMRETMFVIKDGIQEVTVFQDALLEGRLAVQKAVALAKGETLDEVDTFIDMPIVTIDNCQEYIDLYEERIAAIPALQ